MGTLFRIVLWTVDQTTADRAAAAAWARVEQLNHTLSDYDPASELSLLCAADADPMPCRRMSATICGPSPATAVEASRLSDGVFDITVGPLTAFNGKCADRANASPEALSQAKECVAGDTSTLDPDHHAIQLLHAHMRLDVGGIAKGYTSGEVLKTLRAIGVQPRPLRSGGGYRRRRRTAGSRRLDHRHSIAEATRRNRRPRSHPQLRDFHVRRHLPLRRG